MKIKEDKVKEMVEEWEDVKGKEKDVRENVEKKVTAEVGITEEITRRIKNCKKCPLYQSRNNIVVGAGGFNKKIMLVGEAPGREEDKQGRPFVGKAGKLLNELLSYAGLTRNDIYITNIVKCRPPHNRDPTKEEIKACVPWLEMQIRILKPKTIITLGRISYSYFKEKFNISEKNIYEAHGMRIKVNTLWWVGEIIPMYHPAAALYNPKLHAVMIEDWKTLRNES